MILARINIFSLVVVKGDFRMLDLLMMLINLMSGSSAAATISDGGAGPGPVPTGGGGGGSGPPPVP